MKILQDDEMRKQELEETVNSLNNILENVDSEDIKSDILDLVTNYETELQDVKNRLAEEANKNRQEQNNEYLRAVWCN